MILLQVLPVLAYIGCVTLILLIATKADASRPFTWLFPAGLGALFLIFSLVTVAQDGLLQFWLNHTTTLAGNQVWFDLLFAVTIAFYLIAPRARALGMPLLPWGIAVFATACVALLPMLARVIWLEQKRADMT